MLRKISSSLLILFLSATGFAQNTPQIVFKYQYLPNKTYVTQSINSTTMNMDLEGVTPNTMRFNTNMEMVANITTGSANKNNDIPITMFYDKSIMSMEMNGKKMEQPTSALANLKMNGWVKGGSLLQIDSITGIPKKDETTKKTMLEMTNKLQHSIKFPERPIKIGDTFNIVMPFTMPMQNVGNMTMNMNTNYLVKEIKEGKAYLDIKQTIAMDLDMVKEQGMKATGNGAGTLIYDIDKHFVTQIDMDSKMQMNINSPNGKKILMDMNVKTSSKTSIK